MLAKFSEGRDVVYGTPDVQQHGLWRNLASRMTKQALESSVGAANAKSISAFRAFRTQIRDSFRQYDGPFVSIDVLLSWGASRYQRKQSITIREVRASRTILFESLYRMQ